MQSRPCKVHPAQLHCAHRQAQDPVGISLASDSTHLVFGARARKRLRGGGERNLGGFGMMHLPDAVGIFRGPPAPHTLRKDSNEYSNAPYGMLGLIAQKPGQERARAALASCNAQGQRGNNGLLPVVLERPIGQVHVVADDLAVKLGMQLCRALALSQHAQLSMWQTLALQHASHARRRRRRRICWRV